MILAIIGTGIAVWVFNLLVKKTSSVFASSVTYLIPIVAIMWGVYDGENFLLIQWVFSILIITSVSLINKKPSTKSKLF